MSFIFVVGPPIWFKWECNRDFIRLAVGPFAAWVLFHDFEILLEALKDAGAV